MIEIVSLLPAEYQEVEYIESSGTQYIDTSVIPTVNTRVVLDIDVLSYPGDYLAIFGERHTTQTTNLFSFWVSSATTFRTDFGSSTGNTTITASVIGRYVIDKNKNVTTVQGITATNPTSTIQTTYSIYLLSNNYGGTADDRRPIAKIYSCQIYDSDILVRDFVPCYRISDNAAGLYDLANSVFYANVGSGTFTVGANSNKHAIVTITPGGVISFSAALRRRMMTAGGGGTPISELPLGTLINVSTDGGAGAPNYEIADKDNLVGGGVVLMRKNIHSRTHYSNGDLVYTSPYCTLDNLMKNTIYSQLPQELRAILLDVTFRLYANGGNAIIRKVLAPTYTMMGFGNNMGVAEGKPLQYVSRAKSFDGNSLDWWLSSFHSGDDYNGVKYIMRNGSVSWTNTFTIDDYGAVPTFAIPSETLYDITPNTDGSYNLIL